MNNNYIHPRHQMVIDIFKGITAFLKWFFKKILASSIIFLPIFCNSQEYSKIITIDSLKKEEIYSRAKIYIATSFEKGKEVTQLNDDYSFTIVLTGAFPARFLNTKNDTSIAGIITYKAIIECRDFKCRITIKDFYHKFITNSGSNLSGGSLEKSKPIYPLDPVIWNGIKYQLSASAGLFFERFTTYFKIKDNW